MLPYFFRHYDELVDRYVFFDDGSTDSTLSILKGHPKAEVRPLPRSEVDSYVLAAQAVHDTCWKESRGLADWVITTAVDELLYAPKFRAYLETCSRNGVTAIPALGYQMLSRARPTSARSLVRSIKTGFPDPMFSKLSLFDPNKISETNHAVGRHSARPSGIVKFPDQDVLLNLHYKYLSFDYTLRRYSNLNNKLGAVDKENRWGYQYAWTKDELEERWSIWERNSVENVFARGYNPHLAHSKLTERWWRKPAVD